MGISVRIGENLSSLIFPCAYLPNLTLARLLLSTYKVLGCPIHDIQG